MKRVIFFIPSIEGGGVEKNFYEIINQFANIINFQIFLITADVKFDVPLEKNIVLICPKNDFFKNKSRFVKSIYCFLKLLSFFSFKKKIIFSFQSSVLSIIASKIILSKIVIRLNTSPSKYVKNFFYKIIFKFFYNLADIVVVNSAELKKKFENDFNIKLIYIYNPLKLKKNINKKISFFKNFKFLKILNIARLTKQKNHIQLLKSLKIINDKKLKFRCCIIGRGNEYNNLKNYIVKNNLTKSIKLLGFLKNAQNYIKSADLFVLSSLHEGLPNVLLEAQSLGVPIISSDCKTGPKEILLNGKLGYLYKTNDSNDLSNNIIKFVRDRSDLKKKSKLAKKYLYRFDYKKNINKYVNLIEGL